MLVSLPIVSPIVSLAGLKGSHTKEKIITVFYAKKRKQASLWPLKDQEDKAY